MKPVQRRTALHALALLGLGAACPLALAQSAWPNKPVKIVVPFAPGGTTDILARAIAPDLSRAFGQSFVIENKGGAGGNLGAEQVAKSAGDGYTLLMALSSLTVIPEADAILGRAPLFALGDLRPIARYTADPTVLAVRADSPWKSVQDFVEDARKRPGQIAYGSSGNYGTMHVPMEILAQAAGIKLNHIPFTGAGPAVVALLGGQIEAVSSGPATVLQHIKAGKLRALAHWGTGKLAALPDVPGLRELGFAADYAQWSGLFAPSGVPDAVLQRVRAAARAAANDPKVKEVIGNAGSPVLFQDTPDFEKYVQDDARKMTEVVKRMGKIQ